MPTAGVVADANVLLSAIDGKSALRVFTEFAIEVHATEFNADEVSEYLPEMAKNTDYRPNWCGSHGSSFRFGFTMRESTSHTWLKR